MRSMTGYGSARAASAAGGQFTVEIQSVNRRQSEVLINLPRELSSLEPPLRGAVNERIARGRVVVNIGYQGRSPASGQGANAVALDLPAARAYYQAMLALKAELGAGGEVSIESVLRAPGVLRSSDEPIEAAAAGEPILQALQAALTDLLAMRTREGARLADDLQTRLEILRGHLAEIRLRQPEATAQYRLTLQERLRRAGLELPIDDERLAKEVVLFADRCDITEEVTRLASHLDQFARALPPGRAGGPHDGFPLPGNRARVQHARRQEQRSAPQSTRARVQDGIGQNPRTGPEHRMTPDAQKKKFSRRGILFVISAPSGAGKTTLCTALRQTPDFIYSVSCTTRPPRQGEVRG